MAPQTEKAVALINKHAVDGVTAAAKKLDTVNIAETTDFGFGCSKTHAVALEDDGYQLEFRVIVICRPIR